jgi:Fe2+ transport system protein FeoA
MEVSGMSLAMVKAGSRVRFVAVDSGRGLQSRLAAMGMVPGAEIEVIQNSFFGPFIVMVKGSRIMLGRGMAQKIIVA